MTPRKLLCPMCGAEMNHHANKVVTDPADASSSVPDPALGGVLYEAHTCPHCGYVELKAAQQ